MPALERDEYFIGERVMFDVDVLVGGAAPPNLTGTTVALIIQPPGGAAEVTPSVSFAPATHAHAEYVTTLAGWHEWRWHSDGAIQGAQQGRFRVLPINT